MKLYKKNWKQITLGEVFKLKSGNSLSNAKIVSGDCPVYGGNGIIGFHNTSMVAEPTIVIGRVGTSGIVHITKPNSWITDNALYPVEYFQEINQYFLSVLLRTLKLETYAQKTAQPSISQTTIYRIPTLLPSLEEQTQIAELFQSIETTIEQAEQQEKNLLKLKKTLSNGLVSKEPEFGNLLNNKNCTPTNFGGVADCLEQHDKQKKDVNRFIGLENIEPENLSISTWGNIADGTTFTKRFSKGDVLFGKRRAYLKKVAIADFDGICSGDILVLSAKENKMLQELLPFYVSAEAFIDHAVSTSAGSLSPRTKWKDLSLFEISIPDLKTQEKILEVFQQIETTLSQLNTQKQILKNLKQKLLNEILG